MVPIPSAMNISLILLRIGKEHLNSKDAAWGFQRPLLCLRCLCLLWQEKDGNTTVAFHFSTRPLGLTTSKYVIEISSSKLQFPTSLLTLTLHLHRQCSRVITCAGESQGWGQPPPLLHDKGHLKYPSTVLRTHAKPSQCESPSKMTEVMNSTLVEVNSYLNK